MDYRVKRGNQEFGPYGLSDLQRYLESGHVLSSDMAMSEGMSGWVPVAQVVGDIPIPVTGWQDTSIAANQQVVDLPPNLHWGWVLVIDFFTRSYFNTIWALVQANWARKLSGKNTPMVLIAMYPAGLISGGVAMYVGKTADNSVLAALGGALMIGGIICMLAGVFSIRNAMEDYYNHVEDIGLSLSGAMTFFFGVIYLQYHINRIARWKKTGALS